MPDRTIAPGPARLRAAHADGLRAEAMPIVVGLCLLALGLFGPFVAEALLAALQPLRRGAVDPVAVFEGSLLAPLVVAPLFVLLLWVSVSLGLARLGPRRDGPASARRRRLTSRGGDGVEPGVEIALAGAGACVLASAALALWAVAPAVRAADASGPALATLWQNWSVRVFLVLGTTCVLLGVVRHLLARRRIVRSLYLSPDEARTASRGSAAG